MDKYSIADEETDELELEPNSDVELNFNLDEGRGDDHTFEEDFERELPDFDPEETLDELTEEDLDLAEMDLDYQEWLNKS